MRNGNYGRHASPGPCDTRAGATAQRQGALLVDIRAEYQRRADGVVPGTIVTRRNHLEWWLDPCSPSRIPEATARYRSFVRPL